MKNSGIEWIGEIPENWEVVKLKTYFIDRSGGSWGDEAKNDDNDRICIRVADFDFEKQRVKDSNEKTVRNYTQDIINKLSISEGALLIEKSGGGEKTPVGRCILPIGYEKCLYANFIDKLQIRVINNFRFTAYLMKSLYQNNITCPYIKQTTGIQNLDITALLSENIIRAPIDEQQKIADYLDKRCENIDGLVELQNRIIEKLKEYKQSVITEAVTKGLNPAAKMKNSGVEWIGEIPENWEVKRLKNICKIRTGSTLSKSSNENYYSDEGLLWVKPDNLSAFSPIEKTAEYINEKGQQQIIEFPPYTVFVCCIGTIGKIGYSKYPSYCNQQINGLIFYESILKRFGLYMIFAQEEQHWIFSNGNVIKIINAVNQGKVNVPIPPIDEQQKIADYLDAKCAEIDRLIEIKQKKIEKLQDYKKSLIYECVTGKREVS